MTDGTRPTHVMAGLDPAIHASTVPRWMAGSSPIGVRITPCRRTYVLRDAAFFVMPGLDPGIPTGTVP
jgi:hypothetical protein